MVPVDTAPYYAMQLWPGLNNTLGGPRRNARAEIVGLDGKAIPRLFSAGELGSIYVLYPQGGANLGECIAFGRIAGENASDLEPWA
jgi:predicted oxidoreductase